MQPHAESIGALARGSSFDSGGEEAEEHDNLLSSTAPRPSASITVPSARGAMRAKIGVLCVLLVAAATVFAVDVWRFRAAAASPKLPKPHLNQVPALPLEERTTTTTRGQREDKEPLTTTTTTTTSPPAQTSRVTSQYLNRLPTTPAQNLQVNQVPTNVVIMAQVGNLAIWPEMRACISSIAEATWLTSNRTIIVRLHLALTERSEVVEADAKNMSGLHQATIVMVKNRGADIGEFMQQLQLMRSEGADIDIILKIHSKSHWNWRRQMLCNLCGNPQQVLAIIKMFEARSNLGIVGPPGLLFGWKAGPREVWGPLRAVAFGGTMEADMQRTWQVIFPNTSVPFPKRDGYLIMAGSCFWARPAPLLSDEFLSAIPTFIDMFPDGYPRGGTSLEVKHIYALERVIPTMIHARFMLDYDVAPSLGSWPYTAKKNKKVMDRPCQGH